MIADFIREQALLWIQVGGHGRPLKFVCVLQLKLGSGGTVLWQLSSIVKIAANHVKRGNINGERGKNMPSAARFMRGPVTFVKLAMTFLNLEKINYLIFGGVRSWAPI